MTDGALHGFDGFALDVGGAESAAFTPPPSPIRPVERAGSAATIRPATPLKFRR
jgi:hypothetical protein